MKPALVVLALSGLAFAQSSVPTVIRSNTRLVLVSVVARDKNGPVADLKQEDFVVLDGKKQRKIASFAVETSTSKMPGAAMPELPPNVFVNSLQRQSETRTSVTVILFDVLNTPITDQPYARKQVVKFLATLHPEDRIALYTMSRSSIDVLHDFTDDPRDLERIIKQYRGVADSTGEMGPILQRPESGTIRREAPSAAEEKLDQMLEHLNQMVAMSDVTTRVRVTTQALEAVANHLALLPGRKNLVWISASFPFSIGLYGPEGLANAVKNPYEVFRDDIERAARALNQANISIYPVDARGLMVSGAYSASLSTILGTNYSLSQVTSWLAAINNAQITMQELADRTGGKAFYNTNDIAGSVRRAIDDTQVSYVLGFYPDEADLDGKYHELRVQVPGHKGLQVQARQGYYADDQVPTPEAALQAELRQALMGPLQASRVGLSVHVTRTAQPEPGSIHLDMLVNASELSLTANGDRWQGAISISVVQLDAQGNVLNRITDPIKLNLKNESMPQYRETGMSFGKDVKAKDKLAQLRVIAMDRDSGAMGSVIIPMSEVQ